MPAIKLLCPTCGKKDGIHLVWGLPPLDDLNSWSGHQIVFEWGAAPDAAATGGHLADTECRSCGHRWYTGQWTKPLPVRHKAQARNSDTA